MPPKKKQDKDDDNERLDRIAIVEAGTMSAEKVQTGVQKTVPGGENRETLHRSDGEE